MECWNKHYNLHNDFIENLRNMQGNNQEQWINFKLHWVCFYASYLVLSILWASMTKPFVIGMFIWRHIKLWKGCWNLHCCRKWVFCNQNLNFAKSFNLQSLKYSLALLDYNRSSNIVKNIMQFWSFKIVIFFIILLIIWIVAFTCALIAKFVLTITSCCLQLWSHVVSYVYYYLMKGW